MAEGSIPVDLLNPGQVFACLGFLEAADVLLGDAEGGFDWSDEANVRFLLRAKGEENPTEAVLNFLAGAAVYSTAPPDSVLGTEKWNVPTRRLTGDDAFPFPLPSSPATLPAVLERSGPEGANTHATLVIDHWGEVRHLTSRDNVKFWAGAGGYPGAALARDALDLVRTRCCEAVSDPFALSAEQSSSFRFDWRRDYIPIDIGFSLNNHAKGRFSTVGFPLVEILAAMGLANARPERMSSPLEYRYGVLGVLDVAGTHRLIDACLLRAGLGAPKLTFPQRVFRMHLGWPGKENQARCITTVTEETSR
jgi:CRISPR-associated protein Csx14